MPAKRNPHIPLLSDEEAQKYIKIVNRAATEFRGQIGELETAIGMLMIGRLYGWRVLVLVHSKKTIRKYEEILEIDVRKMFDDEGPLTYKSVGYEWAQKLGNFWKAVSGDLKVENRREMV